MVSPWMPNGDVVAFVRAHWQVYPVVRLVCHFPAQSRWIPAHAPQLLGITRGLEYIHTLDIIHGDLRGVCTMRNSDKLCSYAALGKYSRR